VNTRKLWSVIRFFLTFFSLFVGWMLFTWSLDPGSLLAGIIVSMLTALLTFRFFIDEDEVARRAHLPRPDMFVLFLLVLVFKMYVASFQVLWQIIRGRINPGVVHFRTHLKTDIARVVLSSSITLTPGTVTLDLDDDHLVVHWLDARTTHSRYAGNLIKGTFEKLLKRVWL